MKKKVAILYSGGTDSTCAAAIMAKQFDVIHLLTYTRFGIFSVENSTSNVSILKEKFSSREFIHCIINVEKLAKFIFYQGYLRNIFKYGFFTISNCGLCALINHIRTLIFCIDNNIEDVADGINREWPFFPAHIESIINEFRKMYLEFGITYHTPVFEFDLPSEPSFLDKLKGAKQFSKEDRNSSGKKSTGRYLYELGIVPRDNIKGTELDRKMQARCFQFIVHNIFVHWYYMPNHSFEDYEKVTLGLFKDKIGSFIRLVTDYRSKGSKSRLYNLIK